MVQAFVPFACPLSGPLSATRLSIDFIRIRLNDEPSLLVIVKQILVSLFGLFICAFVAFLPVEREKPKMPPHIQLHPIVKEALLGASRAIFRQLPVTPFKTGSKPLKKALTQQNLFKEMYRPLNKQYRLDRRARLTFPGFDTIENEERIERNERLRMHGKGPPQKGAGKRKTRK